MEDVVDKRRHPDRVSTFPGSFSLELLDRTSIIEAHRRATANEDFVRTFRDTNSGFLNRGPIRSDSGCWR